MNQSLVTWYRLLPLGVLPILLALAVYYPVLTHSFLSDDEVIVRSLLDANGQLSAAQVLAAFRGPWLGLELAGYYRPLVSASLWLSQVLAGNVADAWFAYLHNIVFLGVSAVALGLAAASIASHRPRLAFLAASLMFVAVPTSHEVACWVSARTSGLEVMFRLVAISAFLLSAGRRMGIVVAAGLCALLCKETAVMLLPTLIVLDLWRHSGSVAVRVRRYAVWTAFALAVLALRAMVVGVAPPPGKPAFAMFLPRLQALLMPGNGEQDWLGLAQLAALVLLALCLGQFAATLRWLLGLLFALALCLPNLMLPIEDNLFGSRYVHGAQAMWLLVLVPGLVHTARWSRGRTAIAVVLALIWFGAAIASDQIKVRQYARSSDARRMLEDQVEDIASTATIERPMALLAVPRALTNVPFVNLDSLFTLAGPPFASRELPLLALPTTLESVWPSNMPHDAEPVRVLIGQGAPACWYDGRVLHRLHAAPPASWSQSAQGNRVVFEAVTSTLTFDAIEFEFDRAVSDATLEWLAADGQPSGVELRLAVVRPDQKPIADLSTRVPWALEVLGGVRGLQLLAPKGVSLLRTRFLEPRLRPLTSELKGRPLPFTALVRLICGQRQSDGATAIVLLSGGPPLRLHVDVDDLIVPSRQDPSPRLLVEMIARLQRSRRFYYYLAHECQGRTERSPLDWFELVPK